MKLLLTLVAVSGASPLADEARGQDALPTKQIDHVMWATGDKDRLAAMLVDTLGLPLVWPAAEGDWSYSTGIAFGNVDLELTPSDDRTMKIISLALQPTDLGVAHTFLEAEGIGHFEPDTAAAQVPWSAIGLRGLGHPMFFIQFHRHDMDERRARFRRVLEERGGGSLGVQGVKEVRLGVDGLSDVLDQWERLFGPLAPGEELFWRVGEGPAIRVVAASESSTEELVVEVASLSRALAESRRLGLVSSATADTLRLDAERLGGLELVLVEPAPAVSQQAPLEVPRGRRVTVDGSIDDPEWVNARRIAGGPIEIAVSSFEGLLQIGVRGEPLLVASLCVFNGETVDVLHASSALGRARFAREGDRWRLTEPFEWRLRNTSLDPDAIQERAEHLRAFGWVANTTLMGSQGEFEFVMSLDEQAPEEISVALGVLGAGDPPSVAGWPLAEGEDGCTERSTIAGPVQGVVDFRPERWLRLVP